MPICAGSVDGDKCMPSFLAGNLATRVTRTEASVQLSIGPGLGSEFIRGNPGSNRGIQGLSEMTPLLQK